MLCSLLFTLYVKCFIITFSFKWGFWYHPTDVRSFHCIWYHWSSDHVFTTCTVLEMTFISLSDRTQIVNIIVSCHTQIHLHLAHLKVLYLGLICTVCIPNQSLTLWYYSSFLLVVSFVCEWHSTLCYYHKWSSTWCAW